MPTAIPEKLVDAYRLADYRIVAVAGAFSIRIGTYSSELLHLHNLHRVESSAVITGWNPYSEPASDEENNAALVSLGRAVAARGLTSVPAVGNDPHGLWPGEPSLLILGITLEAAIDLGDEVRQNAIVWTGCDALPQLILLR
jgi:hypothetical protein